MKRLNFMLTILVVFISAMVLFASEFKVYPGAKIDEKATKEARDVAMAAKTASTKPTIPPQILFKKWFPSIKGLPKNI